jgi:hypothetical protein
MQELYLIVSNSIEDDTPVDRVLDGLYEPMKTIENIIISLTYMQERPIKRNLLS